MSDGKKNPAQQTDGFGFELWRGILEAAGKMTPEELRRSDEELRAKWEYLGLSFPLYCLLLFLGDDGPLEWRVVNNGRPLSDAQAARALHVTRRQARRWRYRLEKAKLAYFLATAHGHVVMVRDHPVLRLLLNRILEIGRSAERGLAVEKPSAAEVELQRAQLLRSWPAASDFVN